MTAQRALLALLCLLIAGCGRAADGPRTARGRPADGPVRTEHVGPHRLAVDVDEPDVHEPDVHEPDVHAASRCAVLMVHGGGWAACGRPEATAAMHFTPPRGLPARRRAG